MPEELLYLKDHIDGGVKTFEFIPDFNEAGKVMSVSVSVYEGRLIEEELKRAEVNSFLSLDLESWATLLAWVHVAFEAKRK